MSREQFKSILHQVTRFWHGNATFSIVGGGWAGMVCDCGKHYGSGLLWEEVLKQARKDRE